MIATEAAASLSIVHLNAFDQHGGAEQLMSDLIETQRAFGHESIGLVGHKTRAESPTIAFETDPDLTLRAELKMTSWPDYEFRGSHRLVRHPAVQQADVIHAHNLYGGYFHPLSLIGLSQFRPLVWSIHDMQALTGYCSHALECPRWQIGCGECPDLTRPGPRLVHDNTAGLWRDKKMVSDNARLSLVGASSWIVSQLQRSLLGRHPISFIPNGIDTATFRPGNRVALRRELGLPAAALIIGSLARSGVFSHPWKGGSHARATIEALRRDHPKMLFLNIGAADAESEPGIRAIAPSSAEALRDALGALDFFLHPSIADTAPLSVIEAMACGLPVVAFRIGGLPNYVTEEEGILAPANETNALIEAARGLAADAALRERLGASARERVVRQFDRTQMAAAYEKVYREAMNRHPQHSLGKGRASSAEVAASTLEEIRLLQGKMLALEKKLAEFRGRRARDEVAFSELFQNRWLRFGLRLGLVRGALRSWLRLKEREVARRRTHQKSRP